MFKKQRLQAGNVCQFNQELMAVDPKNILTRGKKNRYIEAVTLAI